jgi:hypothetical protein
MNDPMYSSPTWRTEWKTTCELGGALRVASEERGWTDRLGRLPAWVA